MVWGHPSCGVKDQSQYMNDAFVFLNQTNFNLCLRGTMNEMVEEQEIKYYSTVFGVCFFFYSNG